MLGFVEFVESGGGCVRKVCYGMLLIFHHNLPQIASLPKYSKVTPRRTVKCYEFDSITQMVSLATKCCVLLYFNCSF